jgi:hypothetical protein
VATTPHTAGETRQYDDNVRYRATIWAAFGAAQSNNATRSSKAYRGVSAEVSPCPNARSREATQRAQASARLSATSREAGWRCRPGGRAGGVPIRGGGKRRAVDAGKQAGDFVRQKARSRCEDMSATVPVLLRSIKAPRLHEIKVFSRTRHRHVSGSRISPTVFPPPGPNHTSCAGYVLSALALFAALSILLQAAVWRTALLGRSDEPSLTTGVIVSSSHLTPRWREVDSNLYGAFPVKRLFWVVLTVFCSERERPFFVPSPAIREEIARYREVLGVDHFIMRCQWPGLPQEQVLSSIQRLGEIFRS